MRILFIMPEFASPSELWIQRMLEQLEPHIVAIGTRAPCAALWHDRIPVLPLFEIPVALARRADLDEGFPLQEIVRRYTLRKLEQYIVENKIEAVFVNHVQFALDLEPVWSRTSVPVFVHCHGYVAELPSHLSEPPFNSPQSVNFNDALAKTLVRRCIFIAKSKCCSQRLVRVGVPPDRIVLKHHGVPIPSFPIERLPKVQGLHILCLGRLVDFKGPDLVIRAFELACEQGFNGHLTIAGDGPLRMTCELLRCRSRYRQFITLLGAVDSATGDTLRAQADIFTGHHCFGHFSHQEESLGVSIIEAMAAALPVIAGRSGAVPEVVMHDRTGLLVNPENIREHAAAFLHLAHNPELRLEMGRKGWERAKDFFSLEQERIALLDLLSL